MSLAVVGRVGTGRDGPDGSGWVGRGQDDGVQGLVVSAGAVAMAAAGPTRAIAQDAQARNGWGRDCSAPSHPPLPTIQRELLSSSFC